MDGSRRRLGFGSTSPLCISGKIPERYGDIASLDVAHNRRRPQETVANNGPDLAQFAIDGRGEGPASYETLHRRTQDMNKKLADYLRRNARVVMGKSVIRVISDVPFRKNPHRVIGEEQFGLVSPEMPDPDSPIPRR